MPQLCHFERDHGEPNDSAQNCVELKSKKILKRLARGVNIVCAESLLVRTRNVIYSNTNNTITCASYEIHELSRYRYISQLDHFAKEMHAPPLPTSTFLGLASKLPSFLTLNICIDF